MVVAPNVPSVMFPVRLIADEDVFPAVTTSANVGIGAESSTH